MEAYRIIALRGEVATGTEVALWEREHSKHRDVHLGELAALYKEANIFIAMKDDKILTKMKSTAAMKEKEVAFKQSMSLNKKWKHMNKKMRNKKYKTAETKLRTAIRKAKYQEKICSGEKQQIRRKKVIKQF